MKNIVIIGAGDLGKEVVWLIEDINKEKPTYLILGFLDDDMTKAGSEFYGYKVLGDTEQLKTLSEKMPLCAVIAIQDGKVRKKIYDSYPEFHKWESIIHPSAVIAPSSTIGAGSMFFPHTTVSVDTHIGAFGLFYIHSTICNDCNIGSFVSVMANAFISERANVGNGCYVSAGQCIQPHRIIASNKKIVK